MLKYIETSNRKIFRFNNNSTYYEVRLDKEGNFIAVLQGTHEALTRTSRKLSIISLMKKKEPKLYSEFKKALNRNDPLYSKIKEID